MRRIVTGLMILVLASALAAGLPGHAAAAPALQAGPQTWTVLAGAQTTPEPVDNGMMAGAWQLLRFYPEHLTINVGDTVVWKLNAMEMHQVIFPAPGETYAPFTIVHPGNPPQVEINQLAVFPAGGPTYDGSAVASSGMLGMGNPLFKQEYQLTFTKAGSYNYLCAMHSAQLPNGQVVGMLGNITVQPAGSAYPQTQAAIDAAAAAAIAADQQAAEALTATATKVEPPTANADGTMTYHGNIGWDGPNNAYMRFAPKDFAIHAGDSIEWTQTSEVTPHTISLLSGATDPEPFVIQPQATGLPQVFLNLAGLAPAGGHTYNGTGIVSSGFVDGYASSPSGKPTYKVTFTQPGTYEFICELHDPMGMNGHITVLAAGSTPGMPTTGHGDPLGWLLLVLVMLCNGGLVLGGLALRRRATRA